MLLKPENPKNSSPDHNVLKKKLRNLQYSFCSLTALFLGAVFYFYYWSDKIYLEKPVDRQSIINEKNEIVQSIKVPPHDLVKKFAGEPIPYEQNFELRERIDREIIIQCFSHSRTVMVLKRAGRWFPIIDSILLQNGIPSDFKYLAVIESDLSNVVSPAGASGFWQFMNNTAVEFGLEISEDVDERYHVEKSTVTACKYLQKAYSKFNNWTLAAASYNMGMGGVQSAIDEQKQLSYYDLYLNQETSRYIARIIAAKSIFENPTAYGFTISNRDLYPQIPYRNVLVTQTIADLNKFALENGTTLNMLKGMNPWLRSRSLTCRSGKAYTIKIPLSEYNYIEEAAKIKGVLPE